MNSTFPDLASFKAYAKQNPDARRLLKEIIFRWRGSSARLRGDPVPWAAYPLATWRGWTGLSRSTLDRRLRDLAEVGLVERGRHRFASFIVSRLASCPKCRATDDLYVVTQDCPAWHHDRLELAELPLRDLLDVIAGDDPIERRAIAARYAIGTAGPFSAGLAKRWGHPDAVFDLLCEITPHTLAEIARGAYRQTGEVITAFLPLLHQQFNGHAAELRSDPLPPETIIGGIPGWTFDKFSREGRMALARFLRADCATANWLRLHVDPRDQMSMLGHAVFRVESGLVTNRFTWPTGVSLRKQADLHSWPFGREDAATLLALTRADIGILNRVRETGYGR